MKLAPGLVAFVRATCFTGAAAVAVVPAGAAASEPAAPAPAVGAWVDADIYKFKLEEVRRCGVEKGQRHAAFDGDMNRVGFVVRVTAKVGEMPLSPRDLTLEIGGVQFRGELPAKQPVPGCGAPLPQRQLRANESVQGVALFLLPSDVDPAKAEAVALSYKPTRWGGAAEVKVPIPACFDACAGAGGKTASKERRGKGK